MQDNLNILYDLAQSTVRKRAAIVAMSADDMAELTIDMLRLLFKGKTTVVGQQDNDLDLEASKPVPAVPIDQSVHDDYVICLEDGQRFKMMRRHLAEHYGLTPDQYRNRWGLPLEYPMTAPNYSKKKAKFARNNNLGKYSRN